MFTYENGDIYEGQWENDKKTGKGSSGFNYRKMCIY